ncbi:MAG: hypothetical protein EOP04_14600 [Proteobacteria bacterium]|nr:MAG: hypothetical protein EOP04_14600 [Pseudomonadota bacterium]
MKNLIIMASLILASSADASSFTFESVNLPYPAGRMVVNAWIDGHELKCVLDTGGRKSVLKSNSFFAGYSSIGEGGISGITDGEIQADTINVIDVKFGSLNLKNHSFLRTASLPFDCIIGNDILSHGPFVLDMPKRKFEFDIPLDLTDTSLLNVYSGLWFGFNIKLGENKYASLWDTGAPLTIVDPVVVNKDSKNFDVLEEIEIADATGTRKKAKLINIRSLDFADVTLKNIMAVSYSLDRIKREVPEVDIVVGYNVIRLCNWHIDPLNKSWRAFPNK